MGVLIAKCPGTGKEFSTGITADRHSLVGLRAIVATSICPHCGAEHAWRIQDARYVDALPPGLSLSPDKTSVEDHKSLSARASSNESRNR
jgi:predicted RNA-binding Zn-ribbon protein involved in translation (DUF1610 family)